MQRLFVALLTAGVFAFSAMACVSPANIEGIAFTAGEQLDLRLLMQMGVLNDSYMIDGEEPAIGIRYRSHYNPRAMAYVGNYGLSYQKNTRINCMGVILPVADSAGVFRKIDTTVFDFAKAVATELAWLRRTSVLTIRPESADRITTTLDTMQNGGLQYWTHAGTALGYNAWYAYDTTTGTWSQSGVWGVRANDLLAGCSVLRPGNTLPPNSLDETRMVQPVTPGSRGTKPLVVRRLGNGSVVVFFNGKVPSGYLLEAFDIRGAVVYSKAVPTGVRSLHIDKPGFDYRVFRLKQRNGDRR